MSRWDEDLKPGGKPDKDPHPEIPDDDPDAPPPTEEDHHPNHSFAKTDPMHGHDDDASEEG